MKIETLTLGMFQTNTYFIIHEPTGRTIVVDPAAEAGTILQKSKKEKLTIEKICLTHGHLDHIGAVEVLAQETGAEVIIHKEGEKYLQDGNYNLSTVFTGSLIQAKADHYVEEGDVVELKGTDIALKVIHAPGHTLDGIAYYSELYKAAFVGDIIFKGSIGRTDFLGGDTASLLKSIETKIFTLPEDVCLYSGHGPVTSVGHEKATNPHFHLFDF